MGQSRYLILNKPYGVLSQFSGSDPVTTLRGYVPIPGVYPVGRLDRDSEGLLLLTDDGALAHRLTDPRFEHPKRYLVQVERVPDLAALEALCQGVVIEGVRTRPAHFGVCEAPALPERPVPIRFRKSVPTAWLEVVLREGRNRQIRKMTAAVGHPTLRLFRVGLGPLELGALGVGAWRELGPSEVRALRRLAAEGPQRTRSTRS